MAMAVENPTRVDDHAGCVHFAGYHTLGLNFHASFCKNHSIKTSRDHHAIPFNLPFDFCVLAEDHRLFGNNIALNVSVDSKRSADLQRAFNDHALVDKTSPLLAAAVA